MRHATGVRSSAAVLLLSVMIAAPTAAQGTSICKSCMDDAVSDTASSPGYAATSRERAMPGLLAKVVFVAKDHHLRLAQNSPTGWQIEIVDNDSQAAGCAMDYDDLGRLIVSYRDNFGSVMFGRKDAAGWFLEPVAGFAGATGPTSITRVPGGVGIAYASPATGLLYYAEKIGNSAWQIETVAPVGGGSADPSLIAENTARAISFHDRAHADLRLATRSAGQPWSTIVVDAAGDVGASSSLIGHAASGQYGIAYDDATHGDLKYAHSLPGGWAIDLVDGANGRVGSACAAVLLGPTPSDLVGIAYYDQLRGDLDYAAKPGPAWLHTFLDTQGDVGSTLACGAGPAAAGQTVGIVYTVRPSGDLYYLERPAAVASVGNATGGGALHAVWLRDPGAAGGRVRFVMPAAGSARVMILDAQGRRIAEPLDRTLPAGATEVAWDGRDAQGHAVGAGVYFARVMAAGHTVGLRGVVLR